MLNRSGVQNTYSHKVRMGNWNEDQELSELRMKEYLQRKEAGQLLVHSVQRHLNSSLSEVNLSYSKDGFMHIGDQLMLFSARTEGVLSVDVSDRINSSEEGYIVTTSTLTQAHVARNVFVVEGYGNGVKNGDVVRLGQPFRLRINPALREQEFYLHSQPISSMAASKLSRKQEVAMVNCKSYDTVWMCQYKQTDKRFEMEGQPVPVNAELIIVHAQTRQALSSDVLSYNNDFGQEYEVCAFSNLAITKKQGLYAELHGKTTTDIPVRTETAPNWFAFLSAASPEMEKSETRPAPDEKEYAM